MVIGNYMIAISSLIFGFTFSSYLISKTSGITNVTPHIMFTSMLRVVLGDFSDDIQISSQKLLGTAEIIFLMIYFTLSLVAAFTLFGICMAETKHYVHQKEEFKLKQMIINVYNHEV